MKFIVGQRVIARHALHPASVGYYGHIVKAYAPDPDTNTLIEPVYDVALVGRADQPAVPWILSTPQDCNPYPFYERELEAAD